MSEFDNLFYMDPVTLYAHPVKTVSEFLTRFSGPEPLRIEHVAGYIISTVFLGFDLYEGHGPSILTFETRAFKEEDADLPIRPSYYIFASSRPDQAWLSHEIAKQLALNGELSTVVTPSYLV